MWSSWTSPLQFSPQSQPLLSDFVSPLKSLFHHCQSDSLSEGSLREIIERHEIDGSLSNYDFFFAVCRNQKFNEGILRCLLEYFPAAPSAINDFGSMLLHESLLHQNVTLNIIQLLINAAPDSVRQVEYYVGWMPLHYLCHNPNVDDMTALAILQLLIEKCPEAVRHTDCNGNLPIHSSVMVPRSLEFYRVLIEAYPGSERMISSSNGAMPLHCACLRSDITTIEYLHKLYPDAIHQATLAGYHPIHVAILSLTQRSDPIDAVPIVKFLLDCDPNVRSQKIRGITSPLRWACRQLYYGSRIGAALVLITVLYDDYPEEIESNELISDVHLFHQKVQSFIKSQRVYSRQAKDQRLMTNRDNKGQLPLHAAIRKNATLGSIKLLVKGNPSALQTPDNSGALPLHVACEHHQSASVTQYLTGPDVSTLDVVDKEGNTAIHYACRGTKYDTIALLLDEHNGASVSKANAHNKLPVHLLWESDAVSDRRGKAYVDAVFRLLRAYPELRDYF
jgi:ankyrin repeat protein